MSDNRFVKFVKRFSFHSITDFDPVLQPKLKKSNVIITGIYPEKEPKFFIICAHENFVIIANNRIYENFLSKINLNNLFIMPKSVKYFQNIHLAKFLCLNQNHKSTITEFEDEILQFVDRFQIDYRYDSSIKEFWKIIVPFISGYLIKESYYKNDQNQLINFISNIENPIKPKIYNEDDFISLKQIGLSSTAIVYLYYHIDEEKLFAVKKQFRPENKLKSREKQNYSKIRHPLLPKFYGTIQDDCLVIEFINGHDLSMQNDLCNFGTNKKMELFVEMVFIVYYLHSNNFIYRDLKPNNIILDKEFHIRIIDFDRMIEDNRDDENEPLQVSGSFNSIFFAPEVKESDCISSCKCDIYSLGMILCYLFRGDDCVDASLEENKKELMIFNQIIGIIFSHCTITDVAKRFNAIELINFIKKFSFGFDPRLFYHIVRLEIINDFLNHFSAFDNQIDPYGFYCLAEYCILNDSAQFWNYLKTISMRYDFSSADSYFCCFTKIKYEALDITNAIKFLTISADKGEYNAQFCLGKLYYENELIKQDIKKSIKYFKSVVENMKDTALDNHDIFHSIFKYKVYNSDRNDKIIEIASEQNNIKASSYYYLGMIYFFGKERDIDKAIQYFRNSAHKTMLSHSLFLVKFIHQKNMECLILIKQFTISLLQLTNFILNQYIRLG